MSKYRPLFTHARPLRFAIGALGVSAIYHATQPKLKCDYSPQNTPQFPNEVVRKHNKVFKLVSSGTRKVTFLSISVYHVGVYVAEEDIPSLNNRLRAISATTSTDLSKYLVSDPKASEFFDSILDDLSVVIRITPVRNTDIAHMRDGFVRGILARCKPEDLTLQGFKDSFPNPRTAFNKDSVMLLTVWKQRLGGLELEIDGHDYGAFNVDGARPLLKAFASTYLSGSRVASEPVRREFVEQIVKEVA